MRLGHPVWFCAIFHQGAAVRLLRPCGVRRRASFIAVWVCAAVRECAANHECAAGRLGRLVWLRDVQLLRTEFRMSVDCTRFMHSAVLGGQLHRSVPGPPPVCVAVPHTLF